MASGAVSRILRISRVVAELERAEAFYRDALGFHRVPDSFGPSILSQLFGIARTGITGQVMRLGTDEIALVQFDLPGARYLEHSRSNDLGFQHLAIVVNDMGAAYRRLMAHTPQAISTGGPQTLPPRNGGVTAFKFRDPDGHPLELLHFPPGQGRQVWHARRTGPCLGIDHSALAVAEAGRSLLFYQHLGFQVTARSSNHGPAQSRLDDLPNARASVTSLRPPAPEGPGLELLAYDPPGHPAPNAILTDWVTLLCPGLPAPTLLRDPDGHRMLLTGTDRGTTAPA